MWKNSCLVQNAEAKELCNCRLVEPFFPPPVPVPEFAKVFTCQPLLPHFSRPAHSGRPAAVTRPFLPLPPAAATKFPALRMWPAVKLSQSSFIPVFSVVSLSLVLLPCSSIAKKKKFSGTKVKSPYYLTIGIWVSYGEEGNWEGLVPLCWAGRSLLLDCASSLARWGTCWDCKTSWGI